MYYEKFEIMEKSQSLSVKVFPPFIHSFYLGNDTKCKNKQYIVVSI